MNDRSDTVSGDGEDLAELIREQCANEIANLRSAAAERVTRIRTTAEAESARFHSEARTLGEARGRQAAAKRVAVAETESRLAWLWAREHLIEEVLQGARQRLAEFRNVPDGRRILSALVEQAVRALPPGAVLLRVSPACAEPLDAATCAALGQGRWQLSVTTDGAPPVGLVAESGDGRLRFDNSIEARLRRGRSDLRRLVLATLLGEQTPEW